MTKYILAVDGGGIRGIIPAVILAEIEKRARKPISKIFDLVAGTSTGGIIVAGLCKTKTPHYTANDLVELYEKYGSYIFSSSYCRSIMSWITGSQYSHRRMKKVLDKYFGNETVGDASSNLIIPTYDIRNNCPFFFKSWKEGSVKLKDALRASTAAPTYFAPKHLTTDRVKRVLIDGGVFANNPAACAYASGKRLFPNDNIILLSIGTGRKDQAITDSRYLGKLAWIRPLLELMFASESDVVNYQMNQVMGDKYMRIQGQLKLASVDLDNAHPANIISLQQEANEIIKDNQKLIDKFCDAVS